MYISKIHSYKVGPIDNVIIEPRIREDGFPNPIVIVGENGSGKSTILSNIVDALYEFAEQAFHNATKSNPKGLGYQYYRIISSDEIHYGESMMFSAIEFDESSIEDKGRYFYKCGDFTIKEFEKIYGDANGYNEAWFQDTSGKFVNVDKKQATRLFQKNVLNYFAPDRYEMPQWMGREYFEDASLAHLSVRSRFSGEIPNPIQSCSMADSNLQWLLDVVADSRPDVLFENGEILLPHELEKDNLELLGIARKNAEEIISAILGVPSYFGLNNRSAYSARFCVYESSTNNILLKNLNALSTGQAALFNMFIAIVRYADSNDINQSIRLENITGIVVIDEIELHLHSKLQREVLPRLLKLFPKIQFIISTHSPLFVLGMEGEFGSESLDIYQMPSGSPILAESFSEFQHAYEYMTQTQLYHEEIAAIIDSYKSKPLIITEGATDWRHLKAAWTKLSTAKDDLYGYKELDFEFLEYESGKDSTRDLPRIDMGATNLATMCESMSKLKQDRILIFIAGADDKSTNAKFKPNGCSSYKNWGNNVYSILLPVPEHRVNTPEICIEHYYKDSEIKTPIIINGIERRLYMGCEFDEDGHSKTTSSQGILFCKDRNSCGPDKIKIIDGQEKKRVYAIADKKKTNIALPKMAFANAVMDQNLEAFQKFDFTAFVPMFDIIKLILTS